MGNSSGKSGNTQCKFPGVMEDLHRKTKDVFPVNFSGVRITLKKGLSDHFLISHTLNLGQTWSTSGYKFVTTYIGDKKIGLNESYPIILGDIDPSGNMNANIVHHLSNKIRCKYFCQFSNLSGQTMLSNQFQTDYLGDRSTTSLALANVDITDNSGMLMAQHLRAITCNLALGSELLYQWGPQVPGYMTAMLSLACRYSNNDYTLSGTISPNLLNLCYYHKCSEQLDVGCQLETNLYNGQSVASVGYQANLSKINLIFRGMIDSNCTVGGVLEKRFGDLPFTLSLSGVIKHNNKPNCQVGCGFSVN